MPVSCPSCQRATANPADESASSAVLDYAVMHCSGLGRAALRKSDSAAPRVSKLLWSTRAHQTESKHCIEGMQVAARVPLTAEAVPGTVGHHCYPPYQDQDQDQDRDLSTSTQRACMETQRYRSLVALSLAVGPACFFTCTHTHTYIYIRRERIILT